MQGHLLSIGVDALYTKTQHVLHHLVTTVDQSGNNHKTVLSILLFQKKNVL